MEEQNTNSEASPNSGTETSQTPGRHNSIADGPALAIRPNPATARNHPPPDDSAPPDWCRRLDSLRAAEWRLLCDLVPLATRLLQARALQRRREPSLADLTSMLNSIARLHQLLAKMNEYDMQHPQPVPLPLVIKEAIQRIYGPLQKKPTDSPNPN